VIVLSFDPGASIGWCLLDVRGNGARYIDSGVERQIWIPSDRGFDFIVGAVDTALQRAELVAIEQIKRIYPRARFAAHMATALAHAEHVAGEIKRHARDRGLPVAEIAAAQARKWVCGKATADDATVKLVVHGRLEGIPKTTNAHVRDAMVVALFAGRKAEVEGMPQRAAGGTR